MAERPGLIRRGRCHVLGDHVSIDDGVIPARFAAQRVTDPAALVPHLFGGNLLQLFKKHVFIPIGQSDRLQPADLPCLEKHRITLVNLRRNGLRLDAFQLLL